MDYTGWTKEDRQKYLVIFGVFNFHHLIKKIVAGTILFDPA